MLTEDDAQMKPEIWIVAGPSQPNSATCTFCHIRFPQTADIANLLSIDPIRHPSAGRKPDLCSARFMDAGMTCQVSFMIN